MHIQGMPWVSLDRCVVRSLQEAGVKALQYCGLYFATTIDRPVTATWVFEIFQKGKKSDVNARNFR